MGNERFDPYGIYACRKTWNDYISILIIGLGAVPSFVSIKSSRILQWGVPSTSQWLCPLQYWNCNSSILVAPPSICVQHRPRCCYTFAVVNCAFCSSLGSFVSLRRSCRDPEEFGVRATSHGYRIALVTMSCEFCRYAVLRCPLDGLGWPLHRGHQIWPGFLTPAIIQAMGTWALWRCHSWSRWRCGPLGQGPLCWTLRHCLLTNVFRFVHPCRTGTDVTLLGSPSHLALDLRQNSSQQSHVPSPSWYAICAGMRRSACGFLDSHRPWQMSSQQIRRTIFRHCGVGVHVA